MKYQQLLGTKKIELPSPGRGQVLRGVRGIVPGIPVFEGPVCTFHFTCKLAHNKLPQSFCIGGGGGNRETSICVCVVGIPGIYRRIRMPSGNQL